MLPLNIYSSKHCGRYLLSGGVLCVLNQLIDDKKKYHSVHIEDLLMQHLSAGVIFTIDSLSSAEEGEVLHFSFFCHLLSLSPLCGDKEAHAG